MFKKTKVSTGVLVALGGVLLAGAMPATVVAQTAPAAPAAQTAERIEITGSRIRTIGASSSSPITSIGKIDIDTTQPVAVEELVRGLSAAYPAIGPGINNGSNGTASIDLRGLGSNRTLVLINGRRFVPATLGGVVDTNSVPVSLLERVDLVTGGASATYGADAVSGVVNFITRRNFTGIEATTLYSVSESGDAKRRKSDLTIGANLAEGRGNVALHIGTTKTDPLTLNDRDYARTVISSTTGNPGGFSATGVPSQFTSNELTAAASGLPASATSQYAIDGTTGLLRPSSGGSPPDGYNTNPPNYFETPLTRTQATALGRFSINEYAEAYGEVFFTRSNVTLNLAPSGTFGATLSVPIGNPFITAPVRQQLCTAYGISAANCVPGSTTPFAASISRRFVEAGPRIQRYDNTSFQYTIGMRGAIPMLDSWSYDAYYQTGRAEQILSQGNAFSASKLRQAVNAVSTTACTVTTGGCVPINLFGPAGTITPAMLNFISTPTFQTTLVTQEVASLSANGDVALAKSPFASRPLSLALGGEQRTVKGQNRSDAVVQTQGEVLGSGAPTPDRTGTIKFNEYFLEASLPLVTNLPFVQSFTLSGGYRNTDFETLGGGSQNYGSWKTGLDWVPLKGLRFRAEQQRATRAPNVNELFQPVVTGIGTLAVDPCQTNLIGTGPTTATPGVSTTFDLTPTQIAARPALTTLCQQTGVPAANVGRVSAPSSSQIANTFGGNPNLGPERADTTTIGVVWEPDFVPGLSLSVDVWKIDINGAVSSPTVGQVINGCYSAALNPTFSGNQFCGLITRNTNDGSLSVATGVLGVSTQSSNLGSFDFKGYDIGVSYRLPMRLVGLPNLGRIDFGLNMSLLEQADFKSLPSVATLNWDGNYGVNTGTPYSKTRFTQRATWTFGDYSLGYNWRFIGKTKVEPTTTVFRPEYTSIKDYSYVDLNGSWQITKNFKASVTVNNAFDKDPPFIGTGIAGGAVNYGNTMPSVYDVIGRRYTVSVTATF